MEVPAERLGLEAMGSFDLAEMGAEPKKFRRTAPLADFAADSAERSKAAGAGADLGCWASSFGERNAKAKRWLFWFATRRGVASSPCWMECCGR